MEADCGAFSTGLSGLDRALCGIRIGDNVVWDVESIADYAAFVHPFVSNAVSQGRKICYFRFAKHEALLESDPCIELVTLNPHAGFEPFLDGIHDVARRAGMGACHVFDSLSDLTADWFCDQMMGNFFQLTCPLLFDLGTVAYFALLRNTHSPFAMVPISRTTQLLLELYNRAGRFYVHPLKVQDRESPQLYTLHVLDGDDARPVNESHTVSEILSSNPKSALGYSQYRLGVWPQAFAEANSLLDKARACVICERSREESLRNLLRMAISRDDRVLALAERYLGLDDLVAIGRRLLGTGLIGGKSVGMLLARAILKKSDPRWDDLLEAHDSFYIPSDVFYTFLVQNGCWEIRRRQLKSADHGEGEEEARRRIMAGRFPEYMMQRFVAMLDYFGQSPIIVRSSSLLEDNFGNSFAGKYDSVFCANQGTPEQRLAEFLAAVKTVYASALSGPALAYRARFDLLDRDEQMALLVQRVSGARYDQFHFPQVAGVGFSFNPYVWNPDIDPEAGMLRLVFGLGTRAVERSDDDYTRLVALNAPAKRPETETDEEIRHSQHKVDLIDLEQNRLRTTRFDDIVEHCRAIPIDMLSRVDPQLGQLARSKGLDPASARLICFDGLFADTPFVRDMHSMLHTLQDAYECPVDVEFTANFDVSGRYRINLVQCRPLQVRGKRRLDEPLARVASEDLVLETKGPVIGQSRFDTVDRIIYVVPSAYAEVPVNNRYAIARLIGRLNKLGHTDRPDRVTMLLGPGRWGTSTPSLGVPVSFSEINTVSILCEIVAMREDLVPDVSFGSHFFCELVEMDMLYMALFPNHEGNLLDETFFTAQRNQLLELVPDASVYEHVVRVFDAEKCLAGRVIRLRADTHEQHVACYVDSKE